MLIRSVLFNFQGAFLTLSLSFLSDDFVIISHLFEFVKRFFKLFSKFFSNHLDSLSRSDSLFESFYIISLSLEFVKRFLKLFFKVFCDLFAFVVPSSRVLVYYITFIDKSQHFFEKFFSFVTYALYN